MPTVGIPRDPLFAALGRTFTEEQFQDLCFEFGIELDEVTTEAEKVTKTRGGPEDKPAEEVVYKIEVPANRYDILCLEGMGRALAVFLGVSAPPVYSLTSPSPGPLQMFVEPSTAPIRPYILCAVLRNCTLGDRAYNSFLDLQDRLHHNIARRRTLVAIGTHDLDTLQPPFRYRALPPRDINFVPLAQQRSFNAEELFEFYDDPKNNSPLRKFLPIIADSPVFPVLHDAQDRVLSLPPIINGNHSRLSPDTRNVLIECTATDLTKGHHVLNTLVAMFSQYSSTPFSIEPVEVIYPPGPSHPKHAGETVLTPNLSEREMDVGIPYIQKGIGLSPAELPAERIPPLLSKMMLDAKLVDGGEKVRVRIPITRPDVMQACDLVEDVAVGYSFNKIPRVVAPTACTGKQQPIAKLTELMRIEAAQMGFTEALTFALCSKDDIFSKMRVTDDGNTAVVISNPKTDEFQVCRTSLLPGLLKTLAKNKKNPLPWKLFEVSDTVSLDAEADVGAANRRRLSFVYSNSEGSGFEVVHGAVERALMMLGLLKGDYQIVKGDEPYFLEGRCAQVVRSNGQKVGVFGTVHPEVLESFELDFPTSAADIDIEAFL